MRIMHTAPAEEQEAGIYAPTINPFIRTQSGFIHTSMPLSTGSCPPSIAQTFSKAHADVQVGQFVNVQMKQPEDAIGFTSAHCLIGFNFFKTPYGI